MGEDEDVDVLIPSWHSMKLLLHYDTKFTQYKVTLLPNWYNKFNLKSYRKLV